LDWVGLNFNPEP